MKLRKLARLCEHNEFGTHLYNTSKQTVATCPGGVFLPDDTLIIEKEYLTGNIYGPHGDAIREALQPFSVGERYRLRLVIQGMEPDTFNPAVLDALSVRDAE